MRWIPVTERLPELETNVLVLRPNEFSKKIDTLMAYLHDSGIAGRSCGRLGESDWLYGHYWSLPAVVKFNTITHWMPLPPAPDESPSEQSSTVGVEELINDFYELYRKHEIGPEVDETPYNRGVRVGKYSTYATVVTRMRELFKVGYAASEGNPIDEDEIYEISDIDTLREMLIKAKRSSSAWCKKAMEAAQRRIELQNEIAKLKSASEGEEAIGGLVESLSAIEKLASDKGIANIAKQAILKYKQSKK